MTTLTIDPMLMADLSATCNSLGYLDDATGKYQKEPECIECVKDLIRFLRRDDENHEIRRALGETKVVVKDLIPIIKHYADDPELLDVTIRLLVNLTTPALILYEEELPAERVSRRYYIEVVQYLQAYKDAFSDRVLWAVLAAKLTALLEKDWESRMEDDRLMIERVLILIRNVLNIPANPAAEKRTDDDASVHDRVLWAMHLAGLDDIILYIAQSDDEQHLCMHVLEVVSLMLREQEAKQLARSGAARSRQEREKDIQELEQIRKQEHEAKQKQMRKLRNLRHTRFGGTYTVKNLASISDRDLIYHRPLAQINELSFDKGKVPRKTPKNRQPLDDGEGTRRSMLTIRLFLKQFCAEMLEGAYNKIMYNVKDDLARSKAQAHDESYYLWAVKFFMEFNRYHHFKVDRVSETLSVSMFHYIQTQLESHLEMMTMEKRKIRIWSKRAHLALRAYQELLFTIQHMDASSETREAARVLKSNLFYMPEYRELIYVLLCKYDPIKMSRKFLTDLVETAHVFIKLLEKFSGGGKIVVKEKRKRKKKSRAPRPAAGAGGAPPPPDPEVTWDGICDELSAAIKGERQLPEDVRPFDAASEVTIEEQRTEAMLRVQELLRAGRPLHALALIRAAREVWPEGDAFGAADLAPEDEFLALREIHFARLPGRPEPETDAAADETAQPPEHTGEENEEEEEEEEEAVVEEREQEFDFAEFIKRFMSPKVLEPYCQLLRHFDTNTQEANYCVVRMFHRVALDHRMPAMLFQASLFRTFQRLMEDPRHYRNPAHKEVIRMAKYILRQFFAMAKTNSKIFMELLFWKTPREAYEVEHGYDSYQEASKATKVSWSEEEEDELLRVYQELRDAEPEAERDLLDRVLDRLICRERTRRQVTKKLRQLGVAVERRGPVRSRPPLHWAEEEVAQLTELWHQLREAHDPLTMIRDRLAVRRPKNRIRDKLLELRLATDRSQLFKKRGRAAHAAGDGDGVRRGDSDASDSDSGLSSDGGGADDVTGAGGGGGDVTGAGPSGPRRPAAAGKERRRRRRPQPAASPQQLARAVSDYMQSDGDSAREVLAWLQESMEETEALRRDDPEEPVPLVPLSEECALALETDAVRKLVTLLGGQPPGEGEMFWRWPASAGADLLARNAALLSDCLAGNGPALDDGDGVGKENEDPADVSQRHSLNRGLSSDEEQTPRNTLSGRSGHVSSDEEQTPRNTLSGRSAHVSSDEEQTPRNSSVKRSRVVSSDEEDNTQGSSAPARSQAAKSDEVSPRASGRKATRALLTSDSEDEAPDVTSGVTSGTQRSHVTRVASDSEDEAPSVTSGTQRSRVTRVASDSEDETPSVTSGVTLGTQRSRVTRVASDSEDETPSVTSGVTSGTQRSRITRVTSDSEDETPSAVTSDTQRSRVTRVASDSEDETPNVTPATQRSRVTRVASDSEGEAPSVPASGAASQDDRAPGSVEASQDGLTGETEKRRLVSSGDEDSDLDTARSGAGAQKKPRRVIDSDSD